MSDAAWSVSAPVYRTPRGRVLHRRRVFSHGDLAAGTLCRPDDERRPLHEEPAGNWPECRECARRAGREQKAS